MNEITSMPIPVTNPMTLLASALERGMSTETIGQLMALQERWEATQARKAFDAAVADAKAKIGPAARNKTGHNSKKYADFSAYAKVVDPIITQHGLSYRFRAKQDGKIIVTCILSHRAGHSEETTLEGPADVSGNKNAIQAIGSTLTYLQRYSLVMALGLAASDDDDGKAAGVGELITDEQAAKLTKMLADKGRTPEQLCKVFSIDNLAELPSRSYQVALDKIAGAQPIKKDAVV
jgi:hypothetical protein